MENHRLHPLAYPPIPKGRIKEEPAEGQENLMAYSPQTLSDIKKEPQSGDAADASHSKSTSDDEEEECQLVAYPPLPRQSIKQEIEIGDSHHNDSEVQQTLNQIGNEGSKATDDATMIALFVDSPADDSAVPCSVIKKEPQSGDATRASHAEFHSESTSVEDGEECILVAYPPLPRGVIKEEIGIVDDCHDNYGMQQQTLNQGGEENARREAITDDTITIAPFVDSPAGSAEMSNARTLRSHSKPSSSAVAQDRKSDENRKKDEDFVAEYTTDAGQKKKVSGKDNNSQEREPARPFECMKCNRSYKQKKYLNRHMAAECGVEANFACTKCGKKYKRKAVLKAHLINKHKIGRSQLAAHGIVPKVRLDFPFKCDKCKVTYKHKESLVRHIKDECGVKSRVKCTICFQQLAKKDSLRQHMMTKHNMDRSKLEEFENAALHARPKLPFQCKQCEKSYKTKAGLRRHVTCDCGIDPSFACSQCEFITKRKDSLIKHLSTVHGKDPFHSK